MSLAYIYWDPDPRAFTLPFVQWPILWYGIFFAVGFAVGFVIFYFIFLRLLQRTSLEPLAQLKKKAMWLADRLTLYIIIATIVGARLGHFLFYESPSDYLLRPLDILFVHKGGLASHGAALGIVLGTILFVRRCRACSLSWLRLLDLISVPTAFAGACIRLGNFFNQEILGTTTTVPWAVIFGHPMDRSFSSPRHPVQLYEAICYLAIFFLLWGLTYRPKYFLAKGRLLGIFLLLTFASRFAMEFFKVEQSALLEKSFFTMGQLLSIPPIFIGLFLSYRGSPEGASPLGTV